MQRHVCVRCVAEKVARDELPECFAEGDMKLNVDKTTHGTMDARRVPASTKLVGSYMDPGEEVSARVAAASKAHYRVKGAVKMESGVSKRLKLRLYEGVVKPTLMLSLACGQCHSRRPSETEWTGLTEDTCATWWASTVVRVSPW